MRRLAAIALKGLLSLIALPAAAQTLEDLVAQLPQGDFDDRAQVVEQIAQTGDDRAGDILQLLRGGDLALNDETDTVVELRSEGRDDIAFDPFTGERLGEVGPRDTRPVRVNNNLRREIDAALGLLRLNAENRATRAQAASAMLNAANPENIDVIDTALADEDDAGIAQTLRLAQAASVLNSDQGAEAKVTAVETLAEVGGLNQIGLIRSASRSDLPAVAEAAATAIERLERNRVLWNQAQTLWYGLSLGSVLLLAAFGLAITFGVMGVINMAHGELVMLGAYTTFVVQDAIRSSATAGWLFDWSLLIAAPLAFLVAGGVGVAIERGCVRFLYGRPLETLLATWGISLILQQTVRTIFGPTNREVGNPDWMSGAFQLGQLTITYNRLWILVFALAVFAALLVVMNKTRMGLQMRAVTQNRSMAANMGIRTGWVDAMTFGLGAGIAGLAGVALSQIDNVSPNLGQSYIVDSFMVVVFGGAGSIWGTLAGAFTIGIANKFIEPWSGAVLAKVLVLIFVILFIQRRPRGLFAVRGRAVDA